MSIWRAALAGLAAALITATYQAEHRPAHVMLTSNVQSVPAA